MKIYGLQKMTLLDYPGHVACTVFLGGCDFRCPFCHNFDLACGREQPVMEEEELLAFLEKRKGLLDGVAITGGEPTLSPGLGDLLGRIRQLGFLVKLDTNGAHPDVLRSLLERELVDYFAMDIKNSPEKYARTAGRETVDLGRIRESIALLMEKASDYEFRTTVVKELHEEDDFRRMGEMIRGAKQYFLQQFTDRDSVPFGNFHAYSAEEMKAFAKIASEYVLRVQLRGISE